MKNLRLALLIVTLILGLGLMATFICVAERKDQLRFELIAPQTQIRMEANDK